MPLFDDLPDGAIERLSAGGFGRGLLTAALRDRLRTAGLDHMGALALATPIDLLSVRKIGLVRVGTIRTHVLNELCRLYPNARAAHSDEATARRRMERFGSVPMAQRPLDAVDIERLDRGEATTVDAEASVDLNRIADTVAHLLLPNQPRVRPITTNQQAEDAREAKARQERTSILLERDREWDEAAPAQRGLPAAGSRPKS